MLSPQHKRLIEAAKKYATAVRDEADLEGSSEDTAAALELLKESALGVELREARIRLSDHI